MLAEPQTGYARCHLFELAAVGVAGLHVERIGLARSATHPQQDAMPPSPRILSNLRGQARQPASAAGTQQAESEIAKQAASVDRTVRSRHDLALRYWLNA